ncbi:MAG: glycosyltransferase family 2 protein [Candidatus Wildermuthbacteria bacterium]|nr:glycosyltransferase family 2 protein [Candidatus Wildermuthbacteria bacterium]
MANRLILRKQPIKSQKEKRSLSFHLILFLLASIALFSVVLVKSKTAAEFFSDPLLLFYTVFVTTFELSRILASFLFRYSTSRITQREIGVYEPSVSFVIPCKNEEQAIRKTVSECFAVNYPPEKLEVIVVNDGSSDGTGAILETLKPQFSSLIVVNWAENQGKRHAMAEGFRLAKGEIVIQLDSDSYIRPDTFRNIIEPFRNPRVGAVSAHTEPANAGENFITKMQTAYYFVSFRILKAAESTFLHVFCCSGCASAYRKSIVLPILDKWLEERFLGAPVTWGDDRALTNWVLRLNFHTIYSDSVRAYTVVPNTLYKFIRQQVRWKKGWFVNSLFLSKFIVKKDAFVAFTYFFPLFFITLMTPFIAIRAFVYNPIVHGVSPLFYVLGMFLIALLVTLAYRYFERENKYWPYVFAWAGLNMILLSFILFYAIFRLRDRRWGTR